MITQDLPDSAGIGGCLDVGIITEERRFGWAINPVNMVHAPESDDVKTFLTLDLLTGSATCNQFTGSTTCYQAIRPNADYGSTTCNRCTCSAIRYLSVCPASSVCQVPLVPFGRDTDRGIHFSLEVLGL